jgi:hypothetical protein
MAPEAWRVPTTGVLHLEWLDARRLRLYPRAVLFAVAFGFILSVSGNDGGATALGGRLGGDFPAFYGAASILARGDAPLLYDWDRQVAAEAPLFPAEGGPRTLPFVYPPYTALFYRPLAALPYAVAYVLYTLLMAGALWVCVRALGYLAPRVARYRLEGYALALGFVPMFMAVGGGQPAALLICALVGACCASSRGHDWLAGLCLGVLFLKPQYALPWLVLFGLAGRWRVTLGAVAVGAVCYALAAALLGPAWLPRYIHLLQTFHPMDQAHNAAHSIGFLGVAEALLGPGRVISLAIGWSLAAVSAALLVRLWVASPTRPALPIGPRLAASAPLVLLIEPHAMQYDAAFLVPSLAMIADHQGRRAIAALGAVYVVAMATPLAERIGVSPAFFAVAGTAWLAIRAFPRAQSQ